MAQYKIKDTGFLDGILKFVIYTKIVDDTRIMRLGWAGHIIRMEFERIPQNFLM